MRNIRVCRKMSAKYPRGHTEVVQVKDYEIIDGKIKTKQSDVKKGVDVE